MSARRKRVPKRAPALRGKRTSTSDSPSAPSRQKPLTSVTARSTLDECVGAICLVEVTLHSLESQEIASPEQEVLKRALKAIWIVHDWIDGPLSNDLDGEGSDLEDRP